MKHSRTSPRTTSTPPKRVTVFIDEANVFENARRAFGSHGSNVSGRIKPVHYGQLLADRMPLGETAPRTLKEVRVYAGQPGSRDARAYAAHRRQVAAWKAAGAVVMTRPLRYPQNWPASPPEQKGVDVQIALDLVVLAIRREYDVAILASADTDLRPALEACQTLPEGCPTLEVAAWKGNGYPGQLRLPGQHIWCHYLTRGDYLAVADRTRYSK